MISYFGMMKRLQQLIGKTGSADGIEEKLWLEELIRDLNTMSRHFSIQLENEVGAPKYSKPYGIVPYSTMPPTRILSLVVLLSAWLGWVLHEKNLDIYGEFKINEAYEFGRSLSIKGIVP
jgi:hypothetical protein